MKRSCARHGFSASCMKKIQLLLILFICSISFTSFISCSSSDDDFYIEDGDGTDDDSDDNSGNNNNNGNNTNKNKLVGNWYYVFYYDKETTHHLYTFDDNMHYTYQYNSGKITSSTQGIYHYTTDSIYFKPDNGKEYKRKLTLSSSKSIKINSIEYHSTKLSSLESGAVPASSEEALEMGCYYDEKGDVTIEITPFWGISKFYYSFSENPNDTKSARTSHFEKMYKSLKLGTKYYLTAYAIDEKGIEHKSKTIDITTIGDAGNTNYFNFNYKSYRINRAEMSQRHGYSGTGTGSNTKYLTFYCSNDTYVEFDYNVAEWEGINKEWGEGTYKISRNGGYYKYGCLAKIDGKLKNRSDWDFTGTLTIKKKSSNYYTFDFSLEEMKGHFEGSIK